MSYSLAEAASRLEAAVERLAEVAGRPRPATGVPAEEVAALSSRLEATIARLRAALPDPVEGEDAEAEGPEGIDPEGESAMTGEGDEAGAPRRGAGEG